MNNLHKLLRLCLKKCLGNSRGEKLYIELSSTILKKRYQIECYTANEKKIVNSLGNTFKNKIAILYTSTLKLSPRKYLK